MIQNKELKIELESLQGKFEDVQEEIEHSLLDKEIAESELEEEKARVKTLEERVGELEVEVGVFKEENGENLSVSLRLLAESWKLTNERVVSR